MILTSGEELLLFNLVRLVVVLAFSDHAWRDIG
jgi:hypothetical protein